MIGDRPDRSDDYGLFFVWMALLLVQIVLGEGLPRLVDLTTHLALLALLAALLLGLAIRRRRRDDWHWPGVRGSGIGFSIFGTIVVAVVMVGILRPMLPLTHAALPKILFILSLGVWNLLVAFNLVQSFQDDYDKLCGPQPVVAGPVPETADGVFTPDAPFDWRGLARGVLTVLVFGVLLAAMAAYYVHDRVLREAASLPAAAHTIDALVWPALPIVLPVVVLAAILARVVLRARPSP